MTAERREREGVYHADLIAAAEAQLEALKTAVIAIKHGDKRTTQRSADAIRVAAVELNIIARQLDER